PYTRLPPCLCARTRALSPVTHDPRHDQSNDSRRSDEMTISKLLGATMVTGALAAGGAVADISGAAAAPSATSNAAASSQSSTPPTSRSAPPGQQQKGTAPKSGPQGKNPCPNMGSGSSGSSGSSSGSGSNSGASYPGVAPGVSYQ